MNWIKETPAERKAKAEEVIRKYNELQQLKNQTKWKQDIE